MLTEKMGRKVDGREVLKGEDLRELGSLHHGPPPLVWLIEKKKPKKKTPSWHIKAPTGYKCGLDYDQCFVIGFFFLFFFTLQPCQVLILTW